MIIKLKVLSILLWMVAICSVSIWTNACLFKYMIITLIGLHVPLTVTISISLAFEFTVHDSTEDLDLWFHHGQNPALWELLPRCSGTILSEPVSSVGMFVSAHLNCPLFRCLSTPTAPPLCSSSSSSLLSRGCQSWGMSEQTTASWAAHAWNWLRPTSVT